MSWSRWAEARLRPARALFATGVAVAAIIGAWRPAAAVTFGGAAPDIGTPASAASEPAIPAPVAGEAEAAPVAEPALPRQSAPAPVPMFGPSAPPISAPPAPIGHDDPLSTPHLSRHRIAIELRFGYRLGQAGGAVPPRSGYGVGGIYELTYAAPVAPLELGVGVDFGSDRYATSEKGVSTDQGGGTTTYDSTRVIQQNTFLVTHTVSARLGPARPFVSLGVGLGVGDFESVDRMYDPGTLRDAQLLGRGSVGVDVAASTVWSFSLRASYTAARRTDPLITRDGRTLPVFGDLLDVGLAWVYRF